MLLQSQFKPLFALTPGTNYIQFNLDVSTRKAVYNFSIPKELIGDYTKAKNDLGWEPKIKFDALVKLMVESDYNKIKERNGL